MNDRLELRALGQSKQNELFGDTPPASGHAAFDQFEQEFVFGRVWSRPGRDLVSRMIATLSALCVGRRLSSLEHYIAAALDACDLFASIGTSGHAHTVEINLEPSQGASLFAVLVAGFYAVLHRYSGQEDIILGTPVAGRVDEIATGFGRNPR